MTKRLSLPEEAKRLREMKVAYREADKEAKRLRAEHDRAEAAFIERMAAEGVDGITVDGVAFSPAETVYSSVNDRAAFVEWAKENDDSLLEFKERKDLINQLVRAHIDDGAELPPGLNYYIKNYVSQTAS